MNSPQFKMCCTWENSTTVCQLAKEHPSELTFAVLISTCDRLSFVFKWGEMELVSSLNNANQSFIYVHRAFIIRKVYKWTLISKIKKINKCDHLDNGPGSKKKSEMGKKVSFK